MRGRGLRNLLLAQENQRDSSLRGSQSDVPGFSEAGGIQLYAKECALPVEASKGKETDFPLEFPKGMRPVDF